MLTKAKKQGLGPQSQHKDFTLPTNFVAMSLRCLALALALLCLVAFLT